MTKDTGNLLIGCTLLFAGFIMFLLLMIVLIGQSL